MALAIDIADAVAAELATGTFSQPIAPRRLILPYFELADLKELRVSVVPKAIEASNSSRCLTQFDVQIDIGIQRRLSGDVETDVPVLLALVEEIAEFLRNRPIAGAAWIATANEPLYAPDHLAEQRVFTSVLTLTYRVLR